MSEFLNQYSTVSPHASTLSGAAKAIENEAEEDKKKEKPTIGERIFNNIAYKFFGWGVTLVATIVIAYVLKDSKNIKVPKWLGGDGNVVFKDKYKDWEKNWSSGIQKTFRITSEKGIKRADNIADKALLTSVTFFGGVVPIAPIRWMEAKKKPIVAYFNKRFGKEGDVERGNANVEKEAPQSWGSLLKARLAAWLTVFATFMTASALLGRSFKAIGEDFQKIFQQIGQTLHRWPKNAYLNSWRDKTGVTLSTSELAKAASVTGSLSPKQERQRYRYERAGDLFSLDVLATTASAILLFVTSRIFAKKSQQKRDDTKTSPTQAPVTNRENATSTENPAKVKEQETEQPFSKSVEEKPLDKKTYQTEYVPIRDYRSKINKESQTTPAETAVAFA